MGCEVMFRLRAAEPRSFVEAGDLARVDRLGRVKPDEAAMAAPYALEASPFHGLERVM